MVKRPHSTMAAIAAILATLGVLMPWCTVTVNIGAVGEKERALISFLSFRFNLISLPYECSLAVCAGKSCFIILTILIYL